MADLKEPRESTIRKLFALSSNRCAFQNCPTPIVEADAGTILAEVCHIRAQNPNGPRFDATQTAEERHSFENLILMCGVHHKVVDSGDNLATYPPERLLEMKAVHEQTANAQESLPVLTGSAVRTLLDTIAQRTRATTHMDFRGASLRAGGEGGRMGGGGGGGGIINIVGLTPAGYRDKIELSGKDATGPGGGGGGGGALRFSGRPAIADDVQNGLRVSSIFMANAAEIRNSLLFVLGGGWERLEVPSVPHRVSMVLVCVFEKGTVAPNTMLAISVVIEDPSGRTVNRDEFDLSTDETVHPVARTPVRRTLSFDAAEAGLWSFRVRSGNIDLADLKIEIRIANA